jgi:chorismate mutase
MSLTALREEIDAVDREIVACLAKRAKLALAVAAAKRADNLPIEDLDREDQVIDNAIKHNCVLGGYSPVAIANFFSVLLRETRKLERGETRKLERGA